MVRLISPSSRWTLTHHRGLGYFNPQIFQLLGYDKIMQFVLNVVTTVVSAVGAYTGVYVSSPQASGGPSLKQQTVFRSYAA